jgi:UDP-glucose 4-epimerase
MILVTGGLGFIGSHIVVELLENNYDIIIIDNLANSKISVLDAIIKITNKGSIKFYCFDIKSENELEQVFKNNSIDGVIHCAGLKAVGESVKNPIKYYDENINTTLTLLKIMTKYSCYKMIFSSSATVYGNNNVPYDEYQIIGTGITNPYGQTKFFIEQILKDLACSDKNFQIISLRYFNPIGAHKSGLIGEDPNDIPNNLMPFLLKVAKNNIKPIDAKFNILSIYGNDYDTIDGTGERDYIHVIDLAHAHKLAFDKLKPGYDYYNIGTGKATTVLQLINKFKEINQVDIPYKIVERRTGDLASVYCLNNKAKSELNFECVYDIDDMVMDSWNFIQKSL